MELRKINTFVPVILNEVETQVQQYRVENREEVVIEERPKEENPLENYNLTSDREMRQTREFRRFGY